MKNIKDNSEDDLYRLKQFMEEWVELYPSFNKASNLSPHDITNRALFKSEFTFENWLNDISFHTWYARAVPRITKCHNNNDVIVSEGIKHKIYRFVDYAHKQVLYVNNKRIK